MIVKTQKDKMIDILETLAKLKPEVKVINCEESIGLPFSDSDKPELVILNGKVKTEDFALAESLIPEGGIIAFTRGNAGITDSMQKAQDLYGDAWNIAVEAIKKGEYITNIKSVLVYVKGASKDYVQGANDWATFKKNYEVVMTYNFKAWYGNQEFVESTPVEEPKPKKRKRRTKEEIEADKAKEENND